MCADCNCELPRMLAIKWMIDRNDFVGITKFEMHAEFSFEAR